MKRDTKYLSAYYLDETDLLGGIENLKKEGVQILDVLTPFPVHGLDKTLGYRRSWIPRIGFIAGAIGAICGFTFQAWVFNHAYPLNFGGKPFFAVPSFIPVTFECAVLFAAFAMVFAFLFRSKLGLGAKNKIYDLKITDDSFVVVADINDSTQEEINRMKELFKKTGAKILEINA